MHHSRLRLSDSERRIWDAIEHKFGAAAADAFVKDMRSAPLLLPSLQPNSSEKPRYAAMVAVIQRSIDLDENRRVEKK